MIRWWMVVVVGLVACGPTDENKNICFRECLEQIADEEICENQCCDGDCE